MRNHSNEATWAAKVFTPVLRKMFAKEFYYALYVDLSLSSDRSPLRARFLAESQKGHSVVGATPPQLFTVMPHNALMPLKYLGRLYEDKSGFTEARIRGGSLRNRASWGAFVGRNFLADATGAQYEFMLPPCTLSCMWGTRCYETTNTIPIIDM